MELEKYNEIEKNLKIWKKYFISDLKAQNSSQNTIKTYNRILDNFIEFCYLERVNDNLQSLKDINKYFLNSYIAYLKDEIELSTSSISLYLKVIKKFLLFITENNEDSYEIYEKIKKVKIKESKKEIESYTKAEILKIKKKLIEKLENTNNYTKYKNYLNLLIILLTGMRAEESLNLKTNYIIDNDDYIKIKIKGKGNKERFNYIHKDDIKIYLDKLFKLRTKNNITSNYLFATKNNKKPIYESLLRFNQRFLTSLFIKPKGLHAYRHYIAQQMVENDINLETIKEWLGHSTIQITSIYYAKTSEKAKRNSIKKLKEKNVF